MKVAPSPKKLRVSSDLEKCFICQKVSTRVEGLITLGRQGYTTFVNAANLRQSKGSFSSLPFSRSWGVGSTPPPPPLVEGVGTEYLRTGKVNTVYTVLKRAQSMFRRLGQTAVILTWDEALYSKARIVKWRNPDESADLSNRRGGFHRATNFMGDIETIMENSGLEDLFVESGYHGSAMVAKIFGGKAYNRGIRVHRLAFEALSRLKWKAFETD